MLEQSLWRLAGAALLSRAAVNCAAWAAPSNDASRPFSIAGTKVVELQSEAGHTYRLFVYVPEDEPPLDGWPALYVLDANSIFASFVEAVRLQRVARQSDAGAVIVGIGYPTEQPFDLERRMYDLTPVPPDNNAKTRADGVDYALGGRRRFARFLLDTVRPRILEDYPVNPDRQALFGHSLGGLFSLHLLYEAPAAFNAVIAASPSIWWNEQAILANERAFAAELEAGETTPPMARLLVLVGSEEKPAIMASDARALAQRLSRLSGWGLRSDFAVLEGETHLSVPTRAITPTLRFATGRP